MSGRISIRPLTYRGREGFSLAGVDPQGRGVRIFCQTREGADAIKQAIKAGDSQRVSQLLRSGK